MELKQKWVKENGVFYPIPGDTTLHATPGNGVFQVYEERSMGGSRVGIRRISDNFEFGYKIYDLGAEDIMQKIEDTWNAPLFVESNHNLGVIFNGLKGTGKTIASKILSNRLGIPVLIVPEAYDGLLGFISSLCFECVVLIDEAEKTFREHSDVLLKLIDGVYNETRKLYVLTTNRLSIDENLLGRPGRIRYIKQFGNLEVNAVKEYIEDNLIDKSMTGEVLKHVDLLEISTIDILKAIIEEVNIHGTISENSMLNIPRASYRMDVMTFNNLDEDRFDEVKEFIISQLQANESVAKWMKKKWKTPDNEDDDDDTNEDWVEHKFNCWCNDWTVAVNNPKMYQGMTSRMGEILTEPDPYGFFITMESNNRKVLRCLLVEHASPSLYRGSLQTLF